MQASSGQPFSGIVKMARPAVFSFFSMILEHPALGRVSQAPGSQPRNGHQSSVFARDSEQVNNVLGMLDHD